MSKLSFRARALDATKPLPIYNAVDLPDLSEYNTINRTVPQMPTGMEKEEETERHLQDVIHAQQSNRNTKHVVIPTPENAIHVPEYDSITNSIDGAPPQYIRLPGLSLDEEVPDYDLDSEDEEWLSLQTDEKPLSCIHFECMMDKLEKGSGNTVLSDRDAQALLRDDEDLVLAVYEYWLGKRLRLGQALIPTVKQERRDGSASGSNPYLAFRKRTEKMQTRKNRKNDETAYMQMQKLKRDLDKAFLLSGMVTEREAKKHEMVEIQMDIFKKRYMLEDWSGSIMTSLSPVATQSATSRQNSTVSNSAWDGSSVLIKMEGGDDYGVHQVGRHEVLVSTGIKRKRRKKYYFPSESPLPPMPVTPEKVTLDPSRDLSSDKFQGDDEMDGKFTFRRKPYIKYCPSRVHAKEWPWDNYDETPPTQGANEEAGPGGWDDGGCTTRSQLPKPKKFRFSRLTLSGEFVGHCRRRMGRGGREMLDRYSADLADEEPFDEAESADLMETEPSPTSTSIPVPPTSSDHTPSAHTPPTGNHTPTLIARQQSVIVDSSTARGGGGGAGEKLLMRSQSMQVMSSSPASGSRDIAESAQRGEEAEPGEQKGVVASQPQHKKSLHFIARSPSPTTKLEFPSLAFIKQPPPGLSPTEHAQNTSQYAGYHHSGDGGYSADSFTFRRLPSFSEYREEMMSFSSLPTSHFTLRPSSTDAELEQSPTQFWNQSDFGYKNDSWNWNQPGNNNSEKMFWLKRTGSEHFSGMNGSSSRPPTPGNYGTNLIRSGNSNGVKQLPVQQQVLGDQESANSASTTESIKKDMSRSSLSVTDSKTIVLTNSPTPWHSASAGGGGGGGGDRKKEMDKLLSQQQLNHKLVNNKSKSSHHSSEKTEKEEASSAERRVRMSRAIGGGDAAKVVNGGGGGADRAKSEEGVANSRSKTEGGGGEVGKEKAVIGGSNRGVAAAAAGNKGGVTKEKGVAGGGVARDTPPTNKLKKESIKERKSPAASSAPLAPPTPASTGARSPSADVSNAAGSPRDVGAEKMGVVAPCGGEKKEEAKKPVKVVDVWSMKGPGSGILSLNARRNAKKPLRKSENIMLGASAESALRITAQFVAKAHEVGVVGVADIVPPLGGILVRGALGNSRSGSSTPTILGIDVPTQQKLSGLGAATVSGLGRLSESNINSSSLQENKLTATTAAKGIEVKRTKSVGADGVGVHVTLSSQSSGGVTPHLPTVSTVTNGTNFQEIFSTKKNSERGLKQALSGTVMNHNSLLENATKSLVPQTLKNSSEVT